MRFAAALAASAAVFLAGCALGPDDELEAHVMNIAPEGARLFDCAWEKNWGNETEVEAAYECAFGAPGTVVSAGDELLVNAGLEGFRLWCDGTRHRLEIAGVQGRKRVLIEVLERGFTSARTVDAANIPPGQVLIDIAVVKLESSPAAAGRRCVPSFSRAGS